MHLGCVRKISSARNPTLMAKRRFFLPPTRTQSPSVFPENVETQLIPHLHNPSVITRLIFTSGLSELCKTLIRRETEYPSKQAKSSRRSSRASRKITGIPTLRCCCLFVCLLLPGQIIWNKVTPERRQSDRHQKLQISKWNRRDGTGTHIKPGIS